MILCLYKKYKCINCNDVALQKLIYATKFKKKTVVPPLLMEVIAVPTQRVVQNNEVGYNIA